MHANFCPISSLGFVNWMCEILVPKMSFHVCVCVYIYMHTNIYIYTNINIGM